MEIVIQVLSSLKNLNISFGRLLSISVANNHYNKEGEEGKKNRCLCSHAHFKVLLWPLKSTLANTWLQQTDSNPIYVTFLPFHMFTAVQTGGEGKIKKNQKR